MNTARFQSEYLNFGVRDNVIHIEGLESDFLLVETGRILADASNEFWDGSYTGEVSNGVPHGQGTWTHPGGQKYVGEWKDDKWHGQGTLTLPDGRKYVGEWKDGNPWNGTFFDKEQNVTGTYADGVWKEN